MRFISSEITGYRQTRQQVQNTVVHVSDIQLSHLANRLAVYYFRTITISRLKTEAAKSKTSTIAGFGANMYF